MTISDPRTADSSTFHATTSHDRAATITTHRLRLALDLSLGALMVSLRGDAGTGSELTPLGGQALPWRRWLTEDLALARTLYTVLRAADADSAPVAAGWAGGSTDTISGELLDDLEAHYEAIEELLLELLHCPSVAPWHALTSKTLRHCHARRGELRTHHPTDPPLHQAADTGSSRRPCRHSPR